MNNNTVLPTAFNSDSVDVKNNKQNLLSSFAAFISTDEISSESVNLHDINLNNENPFPLTVFPEKIQEIVKAATKGLDFSVDFLASSMIYATSVSIGNTYCIQVKNGWKESAVVYMALVGLPGVNKSHPLSFAIQPLLNHDEQTHFVYQEKLKEFQNTIKSKKQKHDDEVNTLIKPIWKKFILSDFTPEALGEVHRFNERGLGVYVDELAGWFKNFNRYNNGSEMEFWLSSWSGTRINIDRKSSDPICIRMPFISVAGTIQNGVLSQLCKVGNSQNGFMDRILFAFPDNVKKSYWSDTELNPIVMQSWEDILSRVMRLEMAGDNEGLHARILKLTADARNFLYEWQIMNTDRINQSNNHATQGIYSKLEIYAIRFSLILQILMWATESGSNESISLEAVVGATRLVEYFGKSALKVNAKISNPLEKYSSDFQFLFHSLPIKFSTQTALILLKKSGIKMSERTMMRFISNKDLFLLLRRGEYQKLY